MCMSTYVVGGMIYSYSKLKLKHLLFFLRKLCNKSRWKLVPDKTTNIIMKKKHWKISMI